ncbi:MAG: formylmethanofuran dehydrogenase subunit A [Candidatus Altiarchaeota archaeon]
MALEFRNAKVYDPVNKIDGEVMSVLVENGRIVGKAKGKPEVIDAKGKVLMPSGVDIHTHVAGSAVNAARMMRPEDKSVVLESRGSLRSGSGFSCPSTFLTGYQYALMGYSTLCVPDVSPLKVKHYHHEVNDIPLMDKVGLLMLGNNYLVADFIRRGETEKLTDYVAWMLDRTKTYGIKLVAPGAFLSWVWNQKKTKPDSMIPKLDITPSDIIRNLERANNELELPHPIHIHLNGMGYYGNYMSALEEMSLTEKRMHVTHLQFNSYGGDSWKEFCSKTDEIMKHVNKDKRITFDVGQITLDYTTTLTADSPFEQYLSKLIHEKWTSGDVELEHGAGIVPIHYSSKNPVNSTQWAVGLELMLLAEDLDRVCLSTDHPNAGPYIRYPRIIEWLMSRKGREEYAKTLNPAFEKKTTLLSLDREYTLYEIAKVTRSTPARILGLKYDGIREGAEAGFAVYDLSNGIEEGFTKADYSVIKGELVVKDGVVAKSFKGVTKHTDRKVDNKELDDELSTFFRRYYSVGLSNYRVRDEDVNN